MKRVILIVLDSVGAGAMHDAADFGDTGTNTLSHIADAVGGLHLPNLETLGLGNLTRIKGVKPRQHHKSAIGLANELSKAKDTTVGHWEICGIHTTEPFPTYPHGFPTEIMDQFERETGFGFIGNRPASGTEIIKELGEEHLRTKKLIVYTSADSVFQIAAHDSILPSEQLNMTCTIARGILSGKHAVGRVIARPFTGEPGNFTRTPQRQDFSVSPPSKTLLDYLYEAGKEVVSIGKIEAIFNGHGITASYHTDNNLEGIQTTMARLEEDFSGLIFTNLVDYDMLYGHRNDPAGYAGSLEEFDYHLPAIMTKMKSKDLLIITADHGCDPTFLESTDHTREKVPLIIAGTGIRSDVDLGERSSFADTGQTIAEYFDLPRLDIGTSYLDQIIK